MEVVFAILLAVIVGGVSFMLLDNWQRRTPASAEPQRRPEPGSGPLFATALSAPPPRVAPPQRFEEPTQRLPPRHLWDDPPRDDDDEDERPPGLWSGWAR